ncbi:hypothetical protein SISNIDRAFT_487239 [Sistotremastrum niveocremeum HHB9708]|uniref:Fungal-type protein kinase domain-containing protein n=1 Tax=Sistotremastrum niveocremeum HHB9708 TaxID=1314777 RepID=A0A164SKD6_9AGAM|nr:hypothetical protein SISNIDRAFT_487239 [Sistotremastrum niveocremeum HHB9708]
MATFLRNFTVAQITALATHLNTAQGTEGEVNSVWNTAIFQYLVQPHNVPRLIEPEASPPGSASKVDLVVADLVPLRDFRVLYEGKSKAGDAWDTVVRQLYDYGGEVARGQARKLFWLIGGKGAEVRFWRFDYPAAELYKMQGLKWERGAVRFVQQSQTPTYRIDQNNTEILGILLYLQANT